MFFLSSYLPFPPHSTTGLVFTAVQASAYVSSGMYGDPTALGGFNCFFIVAQLTFAGFLVLMIDELLTKVGVFLDYLGGGLLWEVLCGRGSLGRGVLGDG